MKTASFMAVLGLLAGGVPGILEAQVPTAELTIWGRVVLPEGHFSRQSGLEVRLERPGRLVLYSVSTDEDGRFQFRNLEEGEYYLYINLEGYSQVLQQVFVRRPNQTNVSVTIPLRRGVGDTTIDGTRKDGPKPVSNTGKALVIDAAILKKYPEKVIREYEESLKEADSGKWDKAADRLKKVISSAPDFYDAQMQLGLAYQRTNRLKEAEAGFQRARALNPSVPQPLINLAGVYLDRARVEQSAVFYPEVVKLTEEAIELQPEVAEAHYFLGSALFKLNELDRAEDALHRSLRYERPIEDARLMLVNVYMKQRRYREALDQLDRYLETNPNSPQRKAIEDMQAQIRKALGR